MVATSKKNASVSLVFSFLYKIVQVGFHTFLKARLDREDVSKPQTRMYKRQWPWIVVVFRFFPNTSRNWRKRALEITLSSYMSWWMSWWILAIPRPRTARFCKSEYDGHSLPFFISINNASCKFCSYWLNISVLKGHLSYPFQISVFYPKLQWSSLALFY